MPNITFEYGTPYVTECHGGIETRNCSEQAVWTEMLPDGYSGALLCDGCKREVESYIKGEPCLKSK